MMIPYCMACQRSVAQGETYVPVYVGGEALPRLVIHLEHLLEKS